MKNLLSLCVCLLLAVPSQARTITVNWDGSGDYLTIQAAINDANDGDTVVVADGIYTGEGNRDIDAGPGGVENIVVRSANGPQNCVIDGQGADYGFVIDALTYEHNIPIALLEGFTITNCKTAIYLHQPGDLPDIKNCIITGNSGDFCGGIACLEWCTMEITECIIKDNIGSGIVCTMTSRPTISNCMIINNNTTAEFYRNGGGIFCVWLANPIIKNCVVSGNEADLGSGLYIAYESEPKIYNTIITGNKASSGGGLYVTDDSDPNITNCTISGNTANSGGGVSTVESSLTKVRNSIIWDNTADEGPDIYRGAGKTSPRYGYLAADFSVLQSDWGGTGNIIADPCFAKLGYWADANDPNIPVEPNDPNAIFIDGDYHLQSQAGRWDPNSESWVTDANTSPCIDTGNPSSDWTAELWPHGKRINMGAFGGTPQASMSLSILGNIADLDNDDDVDYKDLMRFADDWLYQQILLSEDLDRNGIVNFTDFAIFVNNWLWTE